MQLLLTINKNKIKTIIFLRHNTMRDRQPTQL